VGFGFLGITRFDTTAGRRLKGDVLLKPSASPGDNSGNRILSKHSEQEWNFLNMFELGLFQALQFRGAEPCSGLVDCWMKMRIQLELNQHQLDGRLLRCSGEVAQSHLTPSNRTAAKMDLDGDVQNTLCVTSVENGDLWSALSLPWAARHLSAVIGAAARPQQAKLSVREVVFTVQASRLQTLPIALPNSPIPQSPLILIHTIPRRARHIAGWHF